MTYKAKYLLIYFLLIINHLDVWGQLSKGGIPIQVEKLKSALYISDLVVMPAIDNNVMRIQRNKVDQNYLKPFTFAHSFDVSLNLNNSGVWYNTNKINVWQLRIRSVGAYSLNLIFNNFRLPEDAKLFIINEKTGNIKGAYTSGNNSESGVFAVEPIAGDELLLQYEEPVNVAFRGELQVSKVAHDFEGITASDHRPLGISGTCNVNINCEIAAGSEKLKDGVCRIIINGTELCTGALINNTLLDGTPYVLTAYHCLNDVTRQKTSEQLAQASVFLFNYESPYCGSIDGDVSHSLSGSTLKASFDSLDFSLVKLNNTIPDIYRPFWVGWNKKNMAPTSSICIHHPLGDIKKIAIDNNAAITVKYSSSYVNNGFWKILEWENGITERGSSGSPLFDQNKLLIGTLTGGSASCPPGNPINDYFEKFALAWDYRKETSKQLKAWLDPINSGAEKLDGMNNNSEQTSCEPKTNFTDTDVHSVVKITEGSTMKGYWSGSNALGFTEFAEQFKFSASCTISGISLGIAKTKATSSAPFIGIKVYNGTNKPSGDPIYSGKLYLKNTYPDAMNYFNFDSPVKTSGNFFISYDLSGLSATDSLVVYMANRTANATNSMFLKNSQDWLTYNSQNTNNVGSAILMEINACNIVDTTSINDTIHGVTATKFYPNPVYGNHLLTIETEDKIDSTDDIEVFDLMGKVQNVAITQTAINQVKINFYGKLTGIYFVKLKANGTEIKCKIAYVR